MSRRSWGSAVTAGVGVGGAYLGMPRLRAAATFDETALPVSSSSAARIGTEAGAFPASTMLDASPAAEPAAGVTAGSGSTAVAAQDAAIIARSIVEARFMITL